MTAEKKAEELYNLIDNHYGSLQDTISILKEYAREMIKLDRIELAKLVEKRLENESQIRAFLIDGSSIINAPQIELL